jgi:hypothetical protein
VDIEPQMLFAQSPTASVVVLELELLPPHAAASATSAAAKMVIVVSRLI